MNPLMMYASVKCQLHWPYYHAYCTAYNKIQNSSFYSQSTLHRI